MPAKWTADLVGKMHLYNIKSKDLAKAVGWHPKYLSKVLNGHCSPEKAEVQLKAALNELIASKGES